MKIGILTFHNADNCGAVLQAYALARRLDSISECQVEIIDYYCSKIEDGYKPSNRIKSQNPMKTAIKMLLFTERVNKIYNGFKSFRNEHLCVSPKRYTPSNLNEICNDYDVVITGSDQVFNLNLTGNDTAYFCDFINDKKRKFTYAASIGDLPVTKEEIDRFISLLNGFEVISFREKSSVNFINKVNPNIKCCTNIDPVFLLSESEWDKIVSDNFKKPYVLYFPVQNPNKLKNVLNTIRGIAKKNRAMPVIVSAGPCRSRLKFKNLGCESPSEFIGYIKNAECVFTTSFHATAFAIIMHKNFFAEVNISRSSRILDLLELTGLSHRAMRDGIISCDYEITEEEWKYADSQIEKEREKAFKYLKSIAAAKDDINE